MAVQLTDYIPINRGGTPTDGSSGTYHVALVSDLTALIVEVSADAGNLITAGTDGGAFLNQAVIQANETNTSFSQAVGTGIISHTNEDGTTATAVILSTDANNDLSVGGDGGLYFNAGAGETTTNLSQAVGTGVITYVNEDSVSQTANVVSANGTQILSVGTDGGALLTQAIIQANETTTSLTYASGTQILTFTNEDGVVNNIDLSALTTDLRVDGASISAGGVITFTVNDAGTATDFTLDLSTYLNSVTDDQANGQFVIASGGGSTTIQKTSWMSHSLAP